MVLTRAARVGPYVLITLLYFALTGEMRREIISTHTITRGWLINLDLDRFIPMMVSRMIMSLKKVATSQRLYATAELPIEQPTDTDPCIPPAADGIQLSLFK